MSEHTSSSTLSEADHQLVRRSAFGAIALVSQAEPGFFATFKESMAGSRALQEAPEDVKELLEQGGFPRPPTGTPEEVRAEVLADLHRVMQVLNAKAPGQARGFRQVVLAAADRVASASDGVAPEEMAVIEEIRHALDTGIAGEPSTGDSAADAPRSDS
ncbi:hypothetical protein [Ornithinimicrobium avium]|uniref:Uncharacterized protein n=1 Tax=Ornithinimicrobium avium TaxID=2283195 RepID=A0A345NIE3_9MICO|nr:hypothetical protein [Ornithinimicrobium avium]AXH94801.1 hypothetical protein DV701_00090 [Ornithinimicrobium avium]